MNKNTIGIMESFVGSTKQKMEMAIKHHKSNIKSNDAQRENYLFQLIQDLEERDPQSKQSVKNILFRERSKRDYNYIRKVFKGDKGRGIRHIDIPNKNDENKWKSITDPIEIEKQLIDRNIVHFGQADNTPFANGDLKSVFGYMGTNNNSEKLI
jgi:hypothetical protein